jgi:hypothetical protein
MKKVVSLFALVVTLVIGVVASQPTDYTIEESIEINKGVAEVFPLVADYKNWKSWSPWYAKDPQMEIKYAEQTSGVGARQDWISKTEGNGYQVTTEFVEHQELASDLVFTAPWEGQAKDRFKFQTASEGKTKVTWTMLGKNRSFVDKFFYLLLGINKMITNDMKSGLQNLSKM